MATITLKNVPEKLREDLRRRAMANRRSLNQEALFCLEQAVANDRNSADLSADESRLEWLAQSKRSLTKVWDDESEDVYNALRTE